MKMKLATLFACIPLVTAAHGAAILLGGFDGNQTESTSGSIRNLDDPVQDAGAVGNFDMSLSTDLTGKTGFTGFDWAAGFQSSNATWGLSTFTTAANTSNNNAVYATDTPTYTHTITMVLSNTGLNDITLDKFHIRVKRDGANSPTGVRFAYASGDLSDTPGGNTLLDVSSAGTLGFDLAFSSFVTDLTLAGGETATFTWVTEGGTGQRLRVDNVGVSGTIVPEPSAALLGGFGLLALFRRRR